MLKNEDYNLIQNISNISQSLYRYDTYIKDAKGCQTCQEMWRNLKKQRENELSNLVKHLKEHLKT